MVNRGRSTGCKTCRQRRVRCDEAKPQCRECLRLGYRCQGYDCEPLRLRFQIAEVQHKGKRQQTLRIRTKRHMVQASSSAPTSKLISPLRQHGLSASHHVKTAAISAFLDHVATLGRNFEWTRGLLEMLVPTLTMESPNSPFSLALNVTALQFWSMAHGSGASSPVEMLAEANARLRSAIQDSSQRSREGTILAALLLQRHERLASVWNWHEPCPLHRNGALALLRQQQLDGTKSDNRGYLISQVLHIEVSSCIREKRPFPIAEMACLENPDILPANPSTILDTIGVSVANHQHKFSLFLSGDSDVPTSTVSITQWLESISDTDAQLQQWQHTLPSHWYPQNVESGKHIDGAIVTFAGSCDVYPNIQIAAIWNTWRVYRILLLRIRLSLLAAFPGLVVHCHEFEPAASGPFTALSYHDQQKDLVQDLVDSVCQSVPFHLGSLLKQVTLSDLEDSTILFPSYHDLDPTDTHYFEYIESKYFMSKDDHRRHAIVQGPWQILHTLNHLVDTFNGDGAGSSLAASLRPGQVNWIEQQFRRVLNLLRLKQVRSLHNTDHCHKTEDVSELGGDDSLSIGIMGTTVQDALAG